MAKTYLVTCGTSCYSHYCKMKGKNHFVKLNELRKELEMTPEEIQADMLQSMTTSVEPVAKLSAELNTLISVGLQEADNVVLFYGNTEEAKVSAKTIEAILLKNSLCESPDLKIVNDLATAKKDLMKGLCELANKLVQKHDEYKEHSDEVIFVVTGGYKAMTAVASVVAMLKGCDTMYLFEHSDVPGNIGVLPLVINEDMIPHNVRPLLAPGKGFKHAELKSNGLSDEQITKWFSKDKETQLYMASPIASLLSEDAPKLPSCITEVPVKVAEASKKHKYPKWGTISKPEQIPDSESKELLRSLSRALSGYAKVIYLGELNHEGREYGIRYTHRENQTVKLSVTMPGQIVFLTVHPERSVLDLDDLCQALFKK